MNNILLMLPGPVNVEPNVLAAMSKNIVNHRGDEFGRIYNETCEKMSKVFKTQNQSYILTSSGTGGMEAAIANIANPKEKILSVVGGKFGERFADIARVHGIDVEELAIEWGTAVTPEAIEAALEADENIKAVSLIHNETSTGVAAPIKEIGKVMKNYDALYVVDTVSSLAGDNVEVDKYGIDVCVTGSQKCLAAPPGLSAITLSDDAWKAVENVDAQTYYFNMKKYRESGNKNPAQTPYTPSVSSIYGLLEALNDIEKEGLDNRIARHHKNAEACRNAVKALGLDLFAEEEHASCTVTAVKMPEGKTDDEIRGTMLNKYGVQLAGGQDHLKGKIFRIGHMGSTNYKELAITFTALGMTLNEAGIDVEAGAGVTALAETYLQ
ncbi:aminotransferase [Methanobrevibacter sp. 87.7]|uniref:pyridoxal-phosphate-dependent aminotransferase family protein n=1 Tax=Methanobrevibacter sp. 87.7 TaxID=387957 RepID=UPI000B4FF1B7|nr:alanine--glyoxylate aminotransferase family protein [Methanobrevibacter sp. 87.7]OWT32437.1 aminotransferase [Methanobrevibacter sp. 87.7]